MSRVSVIICAFNEGKRIGSVLDAVVGHANIDEIIVVDDGSADDTATKVKSYPEVSLVRYENNKGKSYAFSRGAKVATGDLLFMLDADLHGLTARHITELLEPVLTRKADVALSLRKTGFYAVPFAHQFATVDYISGERVFPRSLVLGHLEDIAKLPGYALEIYLNRLILDKKYRVEIVRWKNVINPWKQGKWGFKTGLQRGMKMNKDMFAIVTYREILYQNYMLLYRSRKQKAKNV